MSGHLCLVPLLRGKAFSLSSLSMMLALVCHIWPVILRYSPSVPSLLSFLNKIINECWFYKMLFLHLLRWSYDFCSSPCLVVYHTDWFVDTEPPLHRWNKSQRWYTWLQCVILFMYYWVQFANIWLRIFASMFMRNIGCTFLVVSLFCNICLIKWVQKCCLLFYFLEKFDKGCY